jgi:hypothetical protein
MRGRSGRVAFPHLVIELPATTAIPRSTAKWRGINQYSEYFHWTWESFTHNEPGMSPIRVCRHGINAKSIYITLQIDINVANNIFSRHLTSLRFIRRSLHLFDPSWTFWYLSFKVSFLHQCWAQPIEYLSSGSRFHVHHYSGEIQRLPKILLAIKIIHWVWRGRVIFNPKQLCWPHR